MTYFQQFNKPQQHVIIDLLNRSLSKHYRYDQTSVTYGVPLGAPKTTLLLPALDYANHVREKSECVITIQGYQNVLRCSYYRLFLTQCMPVVYLQGIVGETTEADILQQLNAKYQILFEPGEVAVTFYGAIRDDESQRVKVTPQPNHLVWAGELDIALVPAGHIALELSQFALAGYNLKDPADLAQQVSPDLNDDLDFSDLRSQKE